MSLNDHSPVHPPTDPLVAVAGAVRTFGHLVSSRDLDDPLIAADIVDVLDALAARVTALPPSERNPEVELATIVGSPDAQGEPVSAGTHCPVTGAGNPLGLAGRVVRDGATMVGHFTFGSASAGLPKVVHGGHLAAAVDGMLGLAAVKLTGAPMITANLEIDYLAPVPIDEEVVITVQVVSHVGRKCVMGALGQRDGKDFLKAMSLLLTPRQPAEV